VSGLFFSCVSQAWACGWLSPLIGFDPVTNPITVGSLFSGIGGLDLGLERAGFEVKWQIENNPYCQGILAKHWPDVKRYGDITTVTGHELTPVDMICGGFPCQPVSVAGQRQGVNDDKGRWLWPEFKRLVGVLRPRLVFVENVPGLLTANDGHAFGDILGDLAEFGYDAEWSVLSAADVGAPHLRKRLWLVAHAPVTTTGRDIARSHPTGGAIRETPGIGSSAGHRPGNGRATLADTKRDTAGRTHGSGGRGGDQGREGACLSEGNPMGRNASDSSRFWSVEPDVGRVAHGIPKRMDRLRGLGNAVVPQCAEYIGRRIRAGIMTGGRSRSD
jgi:DNA (cytosine-5)-methyltransferase 1